ncbi:MAG TPA: hypothetical protein VNR36_04295 [Pseudolysinimonas sp.]|nr:hypothetical protein [Pseudolysinimonas sp.]
MIRSARATLILPLVLAGLALTACGPGFPVSDPAPDPQPTESSTPPEPAGPVFALPADCDEIASAATLASVFGMVEPRDPADLTRPAPASATKQLTCSWFAGDVTGGDVIYYATTQAAAEAYLEVVAADGYACTEALEGTRCDRTTTNAEFGTTGIETVFTRDDEWIYIGTSNLEPAPLLPDIVATAWSS